MIIPWTRRNRKMKNICVVVNVYEKFFIFSRDPKNKMLVKIPFDKFYEPFYAKETQIIECFESITKETFKGDREVVCEIDSYTMEKIKEIASKNKAIVQNM